ncbi:hypothetical protein FCM35_KLT08392 [Carex littledalei]|uniref:EF-hand domain-containing protein n=1 Tax=Carex littledalei TaxID=544730 RepID=A0A833QVZ5_9POAL|nr:hypothetical protein FCM35_KLT08392 [Carex littledalei]
MRKLRQHRLGLAAAPVGLQQCLPQPNTMALKQVSSSTGDMTIEEFKEWLKQLDTNKVGQLSRQELRQALRQADRSCGKP